jgi:acyl transferase domain-containing protein
LKLLAACGVRPDMVAGHSYGEYVALHAAGAIGERTLAVLSERRGSAIADAVRDRPGQMVAAAADPTAIRAALGARDGVWLANFNAPRQTIIAGEEAAVDDAAAALVRSGIMTFRLPVACAFHTPLMHEARARLDDALEAAAFVRPQLPVYSNALAGPYPDDPAQMRTVLADHLESPVRFVEEIREMYDAGARIFVEVGPGTVLTKLARQIVPDAVTVALDESDTQGVVRFLHALARLAAQGVSVDPARLARQRVTEALDVQLRRVTSRATPAWVVNGAGARSLAVASKAGRAARLRGAGSDANREKTPAPTAPEPLPLPQSFSAAESSMHNRVAPEQDHSAAGAAVPSAGPDAVMVQFQGVMARFLETQAAIMAAYLGAPAGATATAQAPLPLQEVPAGLSTGGTHAALAPSPPPAAVPAARPVMLAASAPAPAPAPVAHVAHAAASSQPPTPQRSTDFATLLVQVAADRTGYAAEMLGLDLSIEADLGIDSIKRVEILSSVRGRCSDVEQERLQTVMDTLTRAKTLREMVQIMKTAAAAAQGADAVAGSPVTVASPSPVSLGQELARVVSERTGYSIEMLGFDLNIEADLGIDSIKRVEILSTFRQRRTAEDQALLQGLMDQLTRLKTLGEMSKTIEEALRAPMATLAAPVSHMVAPLSATTVSDSAARVLLSVAAAPAAIPTPSSRAEMGVTLVTDDGGGVARDVCTRLRASGERVVLLRQRPGAEVELADGECTADWTNAAPAARALDRIRRAGPVAALLHVAPLAASGTRLERMPLSSWQQRVHADLRQLHVLVQAVAPDLQTAGRARGAAILAATALGGDFGEAGRFDRPTHGGVLGYMRTVAIEYPDVRTRVVDVSPETSPGGVAERIVTELDVEGPLEIGYADRGRMTVVPRRAPLTRSAPIPIDRETVVLLTGGARGITAELALELARRFRPTLVLAGLSALSSEPESASTLGLEGNHLRTALARQLGHANIPARPVDVEAAYRRIVHQREIHETLDAIRAAGSAVEYHQVDVRSEASLTGFVESLYQRFGRLDVVVHGAGVIEDKLIEDKSVESFDRVVQTKADSALLLLQCLRHDTLRAFVLMSSVTAAFGNRGQADYGAANGVYNALAQYLAARSRGRVVAMNWGPWDKRGMASEGVRRQFLARGITPIDPALGVRAVLDELAAGLPSDAVVVVGDGPWAGEAPADRVMELHA